MQCRTCDTSLSEGYGQAFCPRCSLADALSGGESNTAVGDAVPGYESIQVLGQGAMGTVWLARERRLDRLVALKVVPKGAILAHRLLSEGRSAARLHHRNIVAVHAIGESDSTSYLAMDFLEGGNLEEVLRRGPMKSPEAAELVSKLAGALQYAHLEGVLHRDLKPSNILLDGSGEPHLGDFGLAAPIAGAGELTLPGQIAGTLAYMAPELARGARCATPQSDIYGLGAILYACITGRPPFLGDSPAEFLTQLATVDAPAPRLIQPNIPRDLETICLKCLERTPSNRYTTAEALEEDLQRFLAGEPVVARPVSGFERGVRWCRRNRALAAAFALAVTVFLILAIGGTAFALWSGAQRRVAEAARAQAESAQRNEANEAAASKAISDFLQNDLLAQAAPDNQPDRDLKLRTAVETGAKRIVGRFIGQPLVEASIRTTLGETFVSLTDYAQALDQFEAALDLLRKNAGAEDRKTLRVKTSLTGVYVMLGKYKEAEAIGSETLVAQKRVLGSEHADTLKTMSNLATLYQKQGRLKEAEAISVETAALQGRVIGPEHRDTLKTLGNLAALQLIQGKLPDAEASFVRVVETMKRALGPENPMTLQTTINLAIVYANRGKLTEAENLQREVLEIDQRVFGPMHGNTLTAMNSLAVTYRYQGKMQEAEALWAQVYEAKKKTVGPEHPDTLKMMNNLTVALVDQSKFSDAAAMSKKLLEIQRRVLGLEHHDTCSTLHNLAIILLNEGKYDEAATIETEALALKKRVLGDTHNETLQSMDGLAAIFMRQGKLAEAEAIEILTQDTSARVLGIEHGTTRLAKLNVGRIYKLQGKLDESSRVLRELLELTERVRGAAPDFNLSCADAMAETLLALRRFEEAEGLLRKTLDSRKKITPAGWQTANTQSLLGEALLAQKRFGEAEPLLVESYRGLVRASGKIPPMDRTLIRDGGNRVVRLYSEQQLPEKMSEWKRKILETESELAKN